MAYQVLLSAVTQNSTSPSRAHEDHLDATATLPLDRDSPLPLYEQIKRRVLAMILGWQQESERFHTDLELAEQFGVSRMTVRQAVQELVEEGYLRRVRGSGTFVCMPKIDERFRPEMDFSDQWSASGRPLTFKVLYCKAVPASATVAGQLGLNTDEPVWSVLRLRTVKHVPISLDYRYVPVARVASLSPKQVEAGSMLQLVSKLSNGLDYGDLKIEAGLVKPEHADYLNLMPGDPVLIRHLVYFDADDQPVMAGISYCRSDQVRYAVRVPLDKKGEAGRRASEAAEQRAVPKVENGAA